MPTPDASLIRDPSVRRKAVFGLVLCMLYALAYAGFVAISLYDVALMDVRIPLVGLNLGVSYGFGLIVLAFALGLIYNHFCGLWESNHRTGSGKDLSGGPDAPRQGGDA